MLEVYLKDDFMDIYLRADYEGRFIANSASVNQGSPRRTAYKSGDDKVDAFKEPSYVGRDSYALGASQMERSSYSPSRLQKPTLSPSKVLGDDGKKHDPSAEEMKERFHLEEGGQRSSSIRPTVNKAAATQEAWTNRKEDWYYENKRLLFASKVPEITDKWIEEMSNLVTPE